MLGIVVSRADEASRAIGEALRERGTWHESVDESRPDAEGGGTVYRQAGLELRSFDALHLDLERPAAAFEGPDLVVFASRHAGETGPLLTAHHTGNFGPADHGGEPNALARACPNALATVLGALDAEAPPEYDVGMEATHHGPTEVGAPSMFVEIGSGPTAWADPAAARAVAAAISALEGVAPDRRIGESAGNANRHLVGFGGGHYVPRYERILRETDWAVGHVAPDWGLEAMGDPTTATGRAVIEQAFERSPARIAVCATDDPGVAQTVEALGYRVVSETWIRATDGVPLALVEALEERVAPVAAGLRFGRHATVAERDQRTVGLPNALLRAARDVDAAATRAAVAGETVAFVTAENGSTVEGPVVVPADRDRSDVLDALAGVLRQGYDTVERRDDEVVATRTVFDPDRARALGVPEGPAFGRLADGQPVAIDGREIDPAAVHRERVDRFDLSA